MGAQGAREGQEDNIEDNRGQYILFIVFVPSAESVGCQLIWGYCWRLLSVGVDCRRLTWVGCWHWLA